MPDLLYIIASSNFIAFIGVGVITALTFAMIR